MDKKLHDYKIAMLATDGVEQVELTEPRRALEQAGAQVDLISLNPGEIQGFNHLDRGERFQVDRVVSEVQSHNYDALVLPGGVANPDALRTDPQAVQFVRDFFAAKKPVGAICHGPWLLVEANVVRHRNLTSWPSLRTDITNAGGHWTDQEVVEDANLVTSRKPADLPAFNARLITVIAESAVDQDVSSTPLGERQRQGPADGNLDKVPSSDREDLIDVASADSFPASDPPSSYQPS
jgi:protease I